MPDNDKTKALRKKLGLADVTAEEAVTIMRLIDRGWLKAAAARLADAKRER